MKRNIHFWNTLPYPTEFFYPYSQSLQGRQTYANVITKFSGIGRLPFSISYWATLRVSRARLLHYMKIPL